MRISRNENSKLLLTTGSKPELLSSVNSQSLQNRYFIMPLRLHLSRPFCTIDCPIDKAARTQWLGLGIFYYSGRDRKSNKK